MKKIYLLLFMLLIFGSNLFAQTPVVTDSATYDVFMNLDPARGLDPTEFSNDVSGYLDDLGAASGSYRIKTSSMTLDPTDVSKWEVYDHYDTDWYANEAAWSAVPTGFNNGNTPGNWYYYSHHDSYVSGNYKITIKDLLDGLDVPNGTSWGSTASLESHIYPFVENDKPSMQFYGYSNIPAADFLYYPADAASTKTVKFDVDAQLISTHTLNSAGFLINGGTSGTGASKTISGYLLLINASLTNVSIYKLNNVNVDALHNSGTNALSTFVASYTSTLPSKSHIELSITSTSVTATIQELDGSGNLTGSQTTMFNSQALDNTGYGGFGPFVLYSSHGCTSGTAFRYSNIEMGLENEISGNSSLESYQFAEYLDNSTTRFFVNLTNTSATDYASSSSDEDNAYLNRMEVDGSILITDESNGTYLPDPLNENIKDVTIEPSDATVAAALGLPDLSGLTPNQQLAAKTAYLIFNTTLGLYGTIGSSTTTAVASLYLKDGPGTDANWTGANQINEIQSWLLSESSIDIYLNPDNSVNTSGLTATYTLTNPSGTETTIATSSDEGKLYFSFPKTSAEGEYTITLSHATGGAITTTVPSSATFNYLPPPPLEGTPSISGTMSNGGLLTVTPNVTNNTGTLSYQWKANGVVISGATGSTYTLTASEVGKTISCDIASDVQTGTLTAAASGTVAANQAPVAVNDSYSVNTGGTVSGNVLTNDTDADTGDDLDVSSTPSLTHGSFTSFSLETGDFEYLAPTDWVGTFTFNYTVTDGMATDVGTDTITVVDTIVPVVVVKDTTVYLNASGMVTIDSGYIDNGSTDNIGITRLTLDTFMFDCDNVGDILVELTAYDEAGNSSKDTATVTVLDSTAPIVEAHDTVLYLNSDGLAYLTPASVDDGSTDNCSIDTMYLSRDTFDCGDIGGISVPTPAAVELKSAIGLNPLATQVYLKVEDVYGNIDSVMFDVTVLDSVAPVTMCKDTVLYLGEDGVETLGSLDLDIGSTDACGIASIDLSQSVFKGVDVGKNQIEMIVTDINGNSSICISTVTVRDTIDPEVKCQNFGKVLDEDGTARIYPAFAINSASDAGGIASYSLDKTRFTCNDIGENTVTVTVKDYGGNTATCQSTFILYDAHGPEVLCKDLEVRLNAQGLATIEPEMVDAGSSDVCGIAEMRLSKTEFTGADLGENEVSFYVTDIGGNTDSCTTTITVTDQIAPDVTCNTISIGFLSETYQLTDADIAALTAGSNDNATPTDSLVIEVSPNSFTCQNIGDSVNVQVSIIDEAGNESTCETKVYVGYVLNQELADITISLDPGQCETEVDYPEVFTSETCASLTLLQGLGADGIFPVGTTIEAWEVVLGEMKDTVSFSVTVSAENENPTLDAISDTTLSEDEALIVELTGISDGGDCLAQELEVSAESLNSGIIEAIDIDYEPGSTTAELSIVLAVNQSGETEVVVSVTDEAGAIATDTFRITVQPENDAPKLVTPIVDSEVQAEDVQTITISKTFGDVFIDADGDELTWSLMVEGDTLPDWMNSSETLTEYMLDVEPTSADTGCYKIVVEVTDPSGLSASDTFELCVTAITVGIADIGSGVFKVKMYPNPTTGLVNIESTNIVKDVVEICVYSPSGSEVFRKEYLGGELIQFDLSDKVSGMYMVDIKSRGVRIFEKLILKGK